MITAITVFAFCCLCHQIEIADVYLDNHLLTNIQAMFMLLNIHWLLMIDCSCVKSDSIQK